MARKAVRRRRKSGGCLPMAIAALCVLAALLVVGIVVTERNPGVLPEDGVQTDLDVDALREAQENLDDADGYALTLTADSFATPEPTVEPETEPQQTEAVQREYDYLPVYTRGDSTVKKIAVLIRECDNLDNLKSISLLAQRYGGKLTLLPTGESVMKDGASTVLKTLALDMGFEIENYTWSRKRVFRLEELEMAEEIWKQEVAVDYALNADYQQHFFCPVEGKGLYDQRTHNYLKQMGYSGVVTWTHNGTNADQEKLPMLMEAGAIIAFTTSDEDLQKLNTFIPQAFAQGYQLVTLNGLLGYPENEVNAAAEGVLAQVMPQPQPYEEIYRVQQQGDYSWSVLKIQRRLAELGYLPATDDSGYSTADGVFGMATADALSAFQAKNGLLGTGVADVQTQEKLFSDGAVSRDES